MVESKRGQFYLIAAIVIIVVIIGFAAVSNYTKTQGYTRTYDIAQELEIESAQVQEFGIYNEYIGVEQMKNFLNGFIEKYSGEVGPLDELYFVFGNENEMVFVGYQQLNESLTADLELNDETYSILEIRKRQVVTEDLPAGENLIETVAVNINYGDSLSEYDFKLKPGENFYFILSQVIGGEKYIEVKDD